MNFLCYSTMCIHYGSILGQQYNWMLNKALPKYEQLPILSDTQIKQLKGEILMYDELIVNTENFSHPGTKNSITNWLNQDITQIFKNQSHSTNAKRMLASLSIGRTGRSEGQGYQLFKQLQEQKMSKLHNKIMRQLDLSFGVLAQTSKLTPQQMEAFVTIPKYFQNTSSIMFTQNKWHQFWYLDRFWVSTPVFFSILLLVAYYLYANTSLFNTYFRIVLFAMGLLLWTIVQYYFHRIVLHVPFVQGKVLNPHHIHHAFPNLRNKLALSICRNVAIQSVAFLLLTQIFMLPSFDVLHLLMGLHSFLIMYDILHYYFHFGPEMQLPIISKLKKNHMKHHFRDSNRGFGVTTTLWDWVFGTQHIL